MPKGTKGNGAKKRGSTKARLHDVYVNRLSDLTAQAQQQHINFTFTDVRPWQNPSDFNGDLYVIPTLGLPSYERTPINTNYLECINNPRAAGTNGDVISLKLQLDHVAAQERAFRHLRASLPRCIANAMGRRYGHGNGPLFELVRDEAEKFIKAGGT